MGNKIWLLILVFNTLYLSTQANSWYVRSGNATGLNGRTWTTAFRYFQVAIDSAVAGDTIRVSAGTFYGYEPSILKSRFGIQSGTVILGGYPATGTPTDADRNFSLYEVILSGEAGTASLLDNVYHLVEGYNLSATTVMDGFIIEKGANGNYTNTYNNFGAGMHLYNSSGSFRNLVFRKNYAGNGGSAICVYGPGSPRFTNCIITDNFTNNGGTLHFTNGAEVTLINCLLVRNRSGNNLPSATIYCNQAILQLTNCTIVNNSVEGYTVNTPAPLLLQNNTVLTMVNSILFHNKVFEYNGFNEQQYYDSTEIRTNASSAAVSYTLLENYNGGTQMLKGVLPRFTDTTSVTGADGKYFTADDGFSLRTPCSPALNAGNNTSVSSILTDITGQPRIFNGGNVDLGPYESQAVPVSKPTIVYVNKSAAGNNTGTSWQNAYTNLQGAIYDCAATVKIAEGTYLPSSTQIEQSFVLQRNMIWKGGYPISGNPTDNERNPEKYPTILDGRLPSTEKVLAVVSSKYTDSTAVIDGLQITGAGITGLKLYYKSSPQLRQVTFFENAISLIAKLTDSAVLTDCNFKNSLQSAIWLKANAGLRLQRTVIAAAGARAVVANNNSSLRADSCTFIKNIVDGAVLFSDTSIGNFNNCFFLGNYGTDGKDVSLQSTSGFFNNCLFADSSTSSNRYGGSVYLLKANPVFTTCSFNQYYGNNGGAIYGDSAAPIFRRCVFDGNVSGIGGALFFENQSHPVLNSCVGVRNRSDNGSFMSNRASTVKLINCTLVRQQSPNQPYAAANVLYNYEGASTEIRNCIFWANNTSYKSAFTEIVNITGAQTTASNSFFQQFGTNGLNGNRVGVNPRLLTGNLPQGNDGLFFTADDGLQLKPCSPAANTGNNQYAEISAVDLAGHQRVYNNVIDAGAYELQETADTTISRTVFVRFNASGFRNGSSWQNAYTSLQAAIGNSCADTIKISEGSYYPATLARDSSFLLTDPVTIFGGYPGTGSPTDAQRDGVSYPTVLNGNIGNPADNTDNSQHVLYVRYVNGPVRLRHLTIQNGLADGSNIDAFGSGVLSLESLLFIDSCRFIKNTGAFRGGGLQATGGWVQLNRCQFDSNSAIRDGGAINFSGMQPGSNIGQSVFWRNTSQLGGALSFNGSAIVYNSLLLENNASYRGGGVYVDGQGVNIVNSTFYANSSQNDYGGGYYCSQPSYSQQSTNSLNNCIFYGNTCLYGNYKGSDLYDANCRFDNDCYIGVQVRNCLTQLYPSALTGYPLFFDLSNYTGPDGRWFTADDGLQLTECSNCVNAGNEDNFNLGSMDITGHPRRVFGQTDLGAYEYQQPINGKVDVRPVEPGNIFFVGDTIRLKAVGANFYTWPWQSGYFEAVDSMARYVLTDTGTRSYYVIGYNQINCPIKADTTSWSIQVLEKPFCPGNAFTLDAGYFQPYYNFYWEADTGNGYHPILDNFIFVGTQSKSLQVLKPDSIPYGTLFRCLIKQDPQPSFYGNVQTIRFADTFNGLMDSNWNNPNNWVCGRVPNSQTDVFVVPGAHPLIVNGIVSCHSFNVQQGAQVSIVTGGQIRIIR